MRHKICGKIFIQPGQTIPSCQSLSCFLRRLSRERLRCKEILTRRDNLTGFDEYFSESFRHRKLQQTGVRICIFLTGNSIAIELAWRWIWQRGKHFGICFWDRIWYGPVTWHSVKAVCNESLPCRHWPIRDYRSCCFALVWFSLCSSISRPASLCTLITMIVIHCRRK